MVEAGSGRTVRAMVASETHHTLARLAEQYRLVAVYAFGSRATEIAALAQGLAVCPGPGTEAATSERVESDVDIGVLPRSGYRLGPRDRVRLVQAMEDALGVGRVDLVVLPEARPFLAADIVSGELLVVTDPDAEAEYQLYVLRRAGDLAPFERQRLAGWLDGTLEPR
jgi:uncharacterized protein